MKNENEKVKVDLSKHWFWGVILQNKGIYIQVMLASIFINIFGFVSAFYIMTVYDRVLPNYAMNSLIALTIGMAVVIIFDFILKMLRSYFSDIANKELDKNVSEKLIDKLLSHDEKIMHSPSHIASTIREFDSVRDFFTSASLMALIDLPFMFLFIIVIFSIAGPLGIVPLLIVPLVLGVSAIVQPFLKRFSQKDMTFKQGKAKVLSELTNNLESVRTVAGGRALRNRWLDSVNDQNDSSISAKIASNISVTFGQTGLQISQVAIIVYGVVLVSNLEISSGALIACVILSGRTLSPLIQAAQLLTRANFAFQSYKSVDQLMTSDSRDDKFLQAKSMSLKSGNIEITNLNFSFSDNPILKDITMSINSGEVVGIVGNLGSGKSTLLKSMIGYHLPEIGMIKVGSFDINNVSSDVLRSQIGYCPQNIQLFSGTIYENIASGIEEATEDDVFYAAEKTLSHNFIASLPGGYNYVLKENGSNLSGGQRQAISLARAIIKKPKILIL
ncbi:ATP-binding cassette domain-containing protein, partial [Hyphomicrobiales bacterium]|nr:ATP-binding cassette domain-containing protein [Hyphomicrobiales bacterium]